MLYLKDTEKWKQFTTYSSLQIIPFWLCYISKILKNESNSQRLWESVTSSVGCVISQRYWKMKAIHNISYQTPAKYKVVLYLKDTEKWKQFTTASSPLNSPVALCYISKILKNESNSQPSEIDRYAISGCVISQRYWKMKAIHNYSL